MEKKCTKCGETKLLNEFYYHRTRKRYMSSCKKCNNKQSVQYQKKQKKNEDINFIMSSRACGIKRDKKNKVDVAPDLKDILLTQYNKQKGLCYYSGEKMELHGYGKNNLYAMTVDRIIPELGYIDGNVVLCCAIVNKIKTNLTVDELFNWFDKIKQHYLKQN